MDQILAKIEAMAAAGKYQREIAAALNKEGILRPHGGKWDQSSVSKFCIDHGKRKHSKRVTKKTKVSAPSALNDVQELITSNLRDDLKLKFLKDLMRSTSP